MSQLIAMLLRVVLGIEQFLGTLPPGTPGFQACVVRLQELTARLRELARTKEGARTQSKQAVDRMATLRQEIRAFFLQPLAALAASVFRENPERAAAFRLPRKGNTAREKFLAKAWVIHTALVQHQDDFIAAGMEPSVVEQFAAALTELESLPEDVSTGRHTRVTAGSRTDRAVEDLMDIIHRLDGLMRLRFRNDPAILAGWQSARNIPWKSAAKPAGEEAKAPRAGDGTAK